jgi:multidrug transporter EmrE-like cation transporter
MMRPVSLPGSLVPLCAALAFLRSARAVRSQKTGHNRVLRLEAQGIKSSILRQPVWVLGLVGMISGEVGNLAAYGDPGTPAAVITAVGCVGVVANLFIATLFLKEPFRYRDLMGSTLVVGGVCLLAIFKLEPEAPLTGERLNMMLYSPGAIGVYCVYGGSILFFLLTIKRIGDIHVIFYLLLSSFIGAFTVISAKPVSTFVIKSFNGIFSGTFSDVLVDKGVKLDDGTWKFSPYAILSAMECAEYDPISVALGFDGTKWVKLQNTADAEILSGRSNALEGCYHRGTGELHQPAFWIFIVILIATAIAQV